VSSFLIRVGLGLYRGRRHSLLLVLSLLSLLFASSLLLPAGLIEVHWNVHGSDPSLSSVVVTAGGAVAVPTSLVSDDLMEDLYRLEGTAWVGRETVAPCVVWHRGVWSPFIVRGVEPVFWRRVPHVLSNSSPLGLGSCFVGVRTGLAVGERLLLASSFTADVVEVEVVGVVATGVASLDHQIYVPREVANLLRGIHSRLSSCVRVGVNASVVSPLLYRQVVEAPHLVVVRVTGVGDPRHVVVGVSYHGSYAEFETNIFGYAVLQLPFGNYTFRCGNLSERRFLVEPVTEVVFDGPEGFVRRAPQPVFFWWESEAFYNFDRVLDRLQITSLSAGSVYTSRVFGDLRVFLVTLAVVILATVGMNVSG